MRIVALRFLVVSFGLLLAVLTGRPVAAAAEPVILVLGDSLSAGYGIALSESWVSRLEQRLRERGLPQRVVNISISGDTTRGGLARLPAALQQHRPAIVILELGANDGLRGLPLKELQDNLSAMIEQCQQAGARVLLTGMRIPPNYGPRYTQKFQATFAELAERYRLALVPFLLEGVAGDPALVQDDGIHPRAEAQERILENVWSVLAPLLGTAGQRASARKLAVFWILVIPV
jgi:acyl-CoA thioesterase-1